MAHPAVVNEETNFAILRVKGLIPLLALCTRCDKKFFTPPDLHDQVFAQEYLRKKFLEHRCLNFDRMKEAV